MPCSPLGPEYQVLSSPDLEPGAEEGWFPEEMGTGGMLGWGFLPMGLHSLPLAGVKHRSELEAGWWAEGQCRELAGLPCGGSDADAPLLSRAPPHSFAVIHRLAQAPSFPPSSGFVGQHQPLYRERAA